VFLYEHFKSRPEEFLQAYCERFDLDVDLQGISMRSSNRSYGPATLGAVRVLNRFTSRTVLDKHYFVHIPYWYGLVRGVGEALNRLPSLGPASSPDRILGRRFRLWIEHRYWESNARLRERTGLPLEEYGYPLTRPGQDAVAPGRSVPLSWLGH